MDIVEVRLHLKEMDDVTGGARHKRTASLPIEKSQYEIAEIIIY